MEFNRLIWGEGDVWRDWGDEGVVLEDVPERLST